MDNLDYVQKQISTTKGFSAADDLEESTDPEQQEADDLLDGSPTKMTFNLEALKCMAAGGLQKSKYNQESAENLDIV